MFVVRELRGKKIGRENVKHQPPYFSLYLCRESSDLRNSKNRKFMTDYLVGTHKAIIKLYWYRHLKK